MMEQAKASQIAGRIAAELNQRDMTADYKTITEILGGQEGSDAYVFLMVEATLITHGIDPKTVPNEILTLLLSNAECCFRTGWLIRDTDTVQGRLMEMTEENVGG